MNQHHDLDFLELGLSLTEEERMAQQTARKFVVEKILPGIETHYQQATFPVELIQEMGQLGFLGCNLSGYGCSGMSEMAYGLIQQELEAGDSGLRSVVSVQSSLAMYAIFAFGSEEQKQHWLPRLAKGDAVGCFALTEPDFGSNPAGMLTKAERTTQGFRLNGSKMWITNGSLADVAVVWARLEGKVCGFLVEKNASGFSASNIKNKLSFRASITSELSFNECEVTESNLLPLAEGLKAPLSCLNQARFGVAWGALGAARTCFQTARDYAISRIQFSGRPIASHQMVQAKLSDMLTEISKAQCLTWQITRLKMEGRLKPEHVSMLKMNNTEMALTVARSARSILGANGISSEYPIMRHLCNLETVVTYEGTTDIHKLTLGRAITGIAAFE
ncbi:MAG: acyl-CoA dehydrogenase family protein [SAR324 cluster bacterium]|nr:acyl-CoA dehydrogenase family protein [SAR324 cluster bacterium]